MKKTAILLGLLFVLGFFSGCTQEEEQPSETPAPTPEETPALSEEEQNRELNDFESTLINEDSEIEIGEII